MPRIRVSITDDADLLGSALVTRRRSAEGDASYWAYQQHPADERDEWGDLASWRRAASQS